MIWKNPDAYVFSQKSAFTEITGEDKSVKELSGTTDPLPYEAYCTYEVEED